MVSLVFACWDRRLDEVAGGEAEVTFLASQDCPWKAEAVEQGAETSAAAGGFDVQDGRIGVGNTVEEANAQGVGGMGFGEAEAGAVEPGASAGSAKDGEMVVCQALAQRAAGGVDGGRILEWKPGLSLDCRVSEFRSGLLTLGLVAPVTGQGQIADPVDTAAAGFGDDVLFLQGQAGGAAVSAAVLPLDQKVFTHFKTEERAALVFDPLDFGIVERLGVEPDDLQVDPA